QEILDGYGKPLGFWRWPSANPEWVGNPGGKPNPLDPQGLLVKPGWNNAGNAQAVQIFEALCGGNYQIHTGSGGTWAPYTNYTVPVIASAAADGKWGVNWGDMSPNASPNDANDNLYNYRLLVGGKGD